VARVRTKFAELLLARSPEASTGRVFRARRGLLIVSTATLAILFLQIRLESFELSGVEVFVHEEWRFLFALLALDAYFLVNYYVVALAEGGRKPRQAVLPGCPAPTRLEQALENVHAYLPFVIGYGAAAWLIVALLR